MAEEFWIDHGKRFPCKDCAERHQACWSDCEKYRKAKEEQAERNRKEKEIKKTEDDIFRIRQKRSTWLKNGFTYDKHKGEQ